MAFEFREHFETFWLLWRKRGHELGVGIGMMRSEQWQKMPPEKRERLLRRRDQFHQLSPLEQGRLRDQFQLERRGTVCVPGTLGC